MDAEDEHCFNETNKELARKYVADAKTFASDGELYKSLKCFKKAYKIFPSEKILNRIERIKQAIEETEEDDDDDNYGFIELDNGLVIFKKLVERLYPHQIEGVKWLFDLYQRKKRGGILADDMGLGKTIQIISFISAMFDMQKIKNILLVLPLSVIPTWLKEFKDWAPGIKVECFHGPSSKRIGVLRQCMMKRSVCITTYGLIITQWKTLSESIHGDEFVWDYTILDEGHRIKNRTKTTKRLHGIPSKNRIILTGTPIQNRVRDMWALMDWVTQGSLLGTQKTFKHSYEDPIERARQRDATGPEIQLGNHMADSLRQLTQPYILRRTKEELIMEGKENLGDERRAADEGQDMNALSHQASFPKLSTKNELVIWVYLSSTQEKIYKLFIELDSVKELLANHRNPLVYLNILKKICDHPRLLSTKACKEMGLQANDSSSCELDEEKGQECAANRIDNISDEILIEESGKLQILIQLLLRLRKEGHRTLVFSMSRKMLNIIQRILMNHQFKIMRLDGLVTKLKEREKRVNLFQQDESYNVFLLTTQVGGVGLTLTGADRVVIYDPSWNPATDAQSVDRIYRIGQQKSVVVYRLITCGTVEEKIYRRQIFKNSMIQQNTCGRKDPYRYFSRQDLAELFVLDNPRCSATQQQLEKLHANQRKWDSYLQGHVEYVRTLKMFGISDHDLMFTRKPDDFDYETDMANNQFDNKVEEAQLRLRLESDQLTGYEEAEARWGRFIQENKGNTNIDKGNEPVYPIEGLSQKLDALNLPFQTVHGSSSEDSHSSDELPDFSQFIKKEPSYDQESIKNVSSDDDEPSGLLNRHISEAEDTISDGDNYDSPVPVFNHESNRLLSPDPVNSTSIIDDVNTPLSFHEEVSRHSLSPSKDASILAEDSPSFTVSSQNTTTATTASPNNEKKSDMPIDESFDEDDHLILAEDSPSFSSKDASLNQFDFPSPVMKNDLTSDDELILAVDSPMLLNNSMAAPSIQIKDDSKNTSFPTEVQESFTIFSDSGSEELDESWKTAFSRSFLNPSNIPPRLTTSMQEDSPIGPRNRRRLQVLGSDSESDSESLLKLANSSRKSMNVSTPHKRRSVSAKMSQTCNRTSPDRPRRLLDYSSSTADDSSSEKQSSSDGTDLDETQGYEPNRSILRDFTNIQDTSASEPPSHNSSGLRDKTNNPIISLHLSDFEDEI